MENKYLSLPQLGHNLLQASLNPWLQSLFFITKYQVRSSIYIIWLCIWLFSTMLLLGRNFPHFPSTFWNWVLFSTFFPLLLKYHSRKNSNILKVFQITIPPWKHQKTKGFLTSSRGIEMEHWSKTVNPISHNKKNHAVKLRNYFTNS